MLGELSERSKVTEVLLPEVTPDLVPGRRERRVCTETDEFRGEDREVREHAGYDDIVLVAAKVSTELRERSDCEVYGFCNGVLQRLANCSSCQLTSQLSPLHPVICFR